jgi:hypothetical protein
MVRKWHKKKTAILSIHNITLKYEQYDTFLCSKAKKYPIVQFRVQVMLPSYCDPFNPLIHLTVMFITITNLYHSPISNVNCVSRVAVVLPIIIYLPSI